MSEIVNPYIAGSPVVDARMFFGRQDVFEWIEGSLRGRYADHILVIHGQRRVGKTSVLKQLGSRLPDRYVPVFFDLQGRTHTTLDRFLWWLAREIVRVLRQDHGLDLPVPEKETFAEDPEAFEAHFLPSLRPGLGGKTLLLTFDEFDNLEEMGIREAFTRPLIDNLQHLMGTSGIDFIFSIGSSGRKLENMQAAYTEFFKTALYKKISFLTESQTHSLITQPVEGILEYEREAIESIHGITSGHPYYTQLICHELFAGCQRSGQRRVTRPEVEGILDDVVERGTVNLKFVWDEASDIEKWGLAALAQLEKRDNRQVSEYLKSQRVRFSEADLTSGLLRLREKDVLTGDNRFVIHLLELWLRKNRPIEQVREELMEINPIANRYIEIGLEYKETGLHDRAIESFRKALEVAKDNIQAQTSLGMTYLDLKAFDKAILEFEKALAMDDEDVSARSGLCDAHLAIGDATLAKGRTREAMASYERVLAINAEHTEARARLAEIHRRGAEKALVERRDEEALSAFTEALKYAPEDPELVARVEKVREEKKARVLASLTARSAKEAEAQDWDAALNTLQEAAALAPGEARIEKRINETRALQKQSRLEALKAKAEGEAKAGRWDEATRTLAEHLKDEPNAEIEARLAQIRARQLEAKLSELKGQAEAFERAERFEEALAAWGNYLALKPDEREEAEGRLEQIRRAAKMAEDYGEAQEAFRRKNYGRAIELLQGLVARDPAYKATTRLLAEAVQARKSTPPWRRKWVRWAALILGAAAVVVFGVYQGPRLWEIIARGLEPMPSPMPTRAPVTPMPTEPPQQEMTLQASVTADPLQQFITSVQLYLSETPPTFDDDFSNVRLNWGYTNEGNFIPNGVELGILAVTDYATSLDQDLNNIPGVSFPTNGMLDAADFALQFDFYRAEGVLLTVSFRSQRTVNVRSHRINLDDSGKWDIWYTDSEAVNYHLGGGTVELNEQVNTFLLMAYQENAAFLLNGNLVQAFVDPEATASHNFITVTGDNGDKMYFDNFKLWSGGLLELNP